MQVMVVVFGAPIPKWVDCICPTNRSVCLFLCCFCTINQQMDYIVLESIDIIHGKLDQKNKQLEVDYAIGRDIRPEEIKKISATLKEWCDSCESVLQTIENQIDRANSAKSMRTKHTEDLEAEVRIMSLRFDTFI